MKETSLSVYKKYLSALNKSKHKYVTAEKLSREVGLYPEIIASDLSVLEPTLMMDPSYNLKDLIPALEEYIVKKEEKKAPVVKSEAVRKTDLAKYDSVSDFVYQKMTFGGIVDKTCYLSDKDLRALKKLVSEELARRKKK